MVVPKLPTKEPATPEEIYEAGRKFGLGSDLSDEDIEDIEDSDEDPADYF